jgi:hypothetical protein
MLGREVVLRMKTPAGDVQEIRGRVGVDNHQYTLVLEIPNLGRPSSSSRATH